MWLQKQERKQINEKTILVQQTFIQQRKIRLDKNDILQRNTILIQQTLD